MLCNFVTTDGTNQWHDIDEIYNVRLYQSANFLNVSCSKRHLACTAVVNGLNNFRVGMPSVLPVVGSPVDTNSYTVCGTKTTRVAAGLQLTVDCPPLTQQFRYVIIQSLDTTAEHLCIAEVAVNATSQYTRLLHSA